MEVADRLEMCDASTKSEDMRKGVWFQEMGSVIVATDEMAGTYRSDVLGGCVPVDYD